MRSDVEFLSGGETIRGHLYLPDEGSGPWPVVVMAGGWCYVKELVQPDYAKVFAGAGLAALVFDYRNLGTSGGTIRQHLDPWEQIEDYRNAISFVETLGDVDASRIGIWGISYPGFYAAFSLMGSHPALKAVSPQAPMGDVGNGDDAYHNGAFYLAANFGFTQVLNPADPSRSALRAPSPSTTARPTSTLST